MNQKEVQAKFKVLEDALKATPSEIQSNEALVAAMDALGKEVKKDQKPNHVETLGQVIDASVNAITHFMKPDANLFDIASGVSSLVSAAVRAAGFIATANPFIGPVATCFKVIGSILGAFGSSKVSRYYRALSKMVTDALLSLDTEQINESLAGTLRELHTYRLLLDAIHSKKYERPSDLLTLFPDITVKSFLSEGEYELGAAFYNLNRNLGPENSANWRKSAETVHLVAQVLFSKVQLLLEGICHFSLAESELDLPVGESRASTLHQALCNYLEENYGLFGTYFGRPTLRSAAITHWIYRMPEEKFRLIEQTYNLLSTDTAATSASAPMYQARYFSHNPSSPDLQPGFRCSIGNGHNTHPGACTCVKLATVFSLSHYEQLSTYLEGSVSNSNASFFDPQTENVEISFHDFGDNKEKAGHFHFALETLDELTGKPIDPKLLDASTARRRYRLTARESVEVKLTATSISHVSFSGAVQGHLSDFYIFHVYPTPEEASTRQGIWPKEYKPGKNKVNYPKQPLVMMGLRNEDKVFTDHNGKEFKMAPYHEIVYKADGYGRPEQCTWQFLSENAETV